MAAPRVRFQKLRPGAQAPRYMSAGAAGLDLASAADEPIEIPPGFEGQVRPRSGLARKFGITLPNAPGTIDSDYRGEVQVIVFNQGAEPFTVRRGDRIAQLVVAPVVSVVWEEADSLAESGRGAGGFGSTGTR